MATLLSLRSSTPWLQRCGHCCTKLVDPRRGWRGAARCRNLRRPSLPQAVLHQACAMLSRHPERLCRRARSFGKAILHSSCCIFAEHCYSHTCLSFLVGGAETATHRQAVVWGGASLHCEVHTAADLRLALASLCVAQAGHKAGGTWRNQRNFQLLKAANATRVAVQRARSLDSSTPHTPSTLHPTDSDPRIYT